MPIVLLSPAKTLDETPLPLSTAHSEPRMTREAAALVTVAKKLTAPKIKSLMGVSDAIATLNYDRFQSFDDNASKQCAHAFDGPAYRGLDAPSMSADDLDFAQTHLRILCGLYGVLRPLDRIKPYRLEMGCKLENPKGKDLYAFWGESITHAIAADLATQPPEQRFVVNCASQEYFKSVRSDVLTNQGVDVYTCVFPGPSVFAKQARGAMCHHVVVNRVTTPEGLRGFTGKDGEWRFDETQSKGNSLVFVRGAPKAAAGAGAKAGVKSGAGAGASKAKAATKTPPAGNKAKAVSQTVDAGEKNVGRKEKEKKGAAEKASAAPAAGKGAGAARGATKVGTAAAAAVTATAPTNRKRKATEGGGRVTRSGAGKK